LGRRGDQILPSHSWPIPNGAPVSRARRLLATQSPHIGAIYGLEEADGVTALVLELVEGPRWPIGRSATARDH
jgi:hypothetical protein